MKLQKKHQSRIHKKDYIILLIAALTLLLSISGANAVEVVQLRCEFRENPIGIDMARPRLNWIVKSDQLADII